MKSTIIYNAAASSAGLRSLSLLSFALFLFSPAVGFAGEPTERLNIGVRAAVDGTTGMSIAKAQARADKTRSQTYGLFFVTIVPGPENLVRPVDAAAVAGELEHQLALQGFTKVKAGTKPEILISGEYGRGWLPNPYETGQLMVGSQGKDAFTAGVPTYKINRPLDALHASDRIWIQKRFANSLEKLYIRVRAWTYPREKGEKPMPIWTTYMVIDDPEHRDLNLIFKDMLAAGANYFGHAMTDPEHPDATVTKIVPVGRVDVGAPTIVGQD